MAEAANAELVEHVVALSFEATLTRLTEAIGQAGLMLFNRVDHHVAAREAGLDMPSATVLTYGHAKGGTPIMLASPAAALDLPLRVLVRVDDQGRTVMSFHPMATILRRAGVPETLAERLAPAQQMLVKAVTA